MTPKSIWLMAQNRPTLIARDLKERFDVPVDATYGVLLARGVFKWFSVRRDLIRLKNTWKGRERMALALISKCKDRLRSGEAERTTSRDLIWARGYLAAIQECRREVRALCHSERWQAPDNDEAAQRWLKRQEVPA